MLYEQILLILNFRSVVDFHRFVGAIVASGGGGDGPEDVMGGMRITFTQLSWRNKSSKVTKSKLSC